MPAPSRPRMLTCSASSIRPMKALSFCATGSPNTTWDRPRGKARRRLPRPGHKNRPAGVQQRFSVDHRKNQVVFGMEQRTAAWPERSKWFRWSNAPLHYPQGLEWFGVEQRFSAAVSHPIILSSRASANRAKRGERESRDPCIFPFGASVPGISTRICSSRRVPPPLRLRLAQLHFLLLLADLYPFLLQIQPQVPVEAHVLVGDPDQGKAADDVPSPILVEQLVARDADKERGYVVAEAILASEQKEKFAAQIAAGFLALPLTILTRLAENLLVGDRPGNAGDGNCQYE